MNNRIVIVGGGLGGLAVAVALKRIGRDVVVCEQTPEIREVGAGITIWTNASHAIRELGIWDEFQRIAEPSYRTDVLRSTGRKLSSTDLGRIAAKHGAMTYTVHRAELQSLLASKLSVGELLLGRRCVEVEQDATSVAAVMESGERVQGAYLIAADGLHSRVRQGLGLRHSETYRGYRCWRAVTTSIATSDGASMLVLGRGCQFGSFPMTERRTYWFATQNARLANSRPDGSIKEEVLRIFAGWGAGVPELIARTPESDVILGDIIDRDPERPWTKGRITLLGDAAHASTPNLGQGACMTLEDAVVLAYAFWVDSNDPLREFEARRFRRTKGITLESRMMGLSFQLQNPLLSAARDLVTWLTPQVVMRFSLERNLRFRVPSLTPYAKGVPPGFKKSGNG